MSKSKIIAIVGDSICGGAFDQKMVAGPDDVFLRGFNTYAGKNPSNPTLQQQGAGEVIAAVNGHVEITDRVVSIKGNLPRYLPEIGDVVVGRITEVMGNRWRVDIRSSQEAVMLLSNVTEPGGMLRRRGRGDELGMRQLFDQEDLIVAEVQRISPDGVVSLHTRAAEKYGKLSSYGCLVNVRPSLVKRAKHQFFFLPKFNALLIIGINGNIWVAQQSGNAESSDATGDFGNFTENEIRRSVARVANCVKVLGAAGMQVYPQSIEAAADASVQAGLSAFDVLLPSNQEIVVGKINETAGSKRQRE